MSQSILHTALLNSGKTGNFQPLYATVPIKLYSFPLKLFDVIELEESSVINWTPCGTAFKVYNLRHFKEITLAKYFRHSKMTSFNKQLNLYGFKKINHGPNAGAYAHPCFLKGRTDLLADIKLLKHEAGQARPAYFIPHEVPASSAGVVLNNTTDSAPAPPQPAFQEKHMSEEQLISSFFDRGVIHGGLSCRVVDDAADFFRKEALKEKQMKDSTTMLDQCQKLQFNSNFHQTSYTWRQMLEDDSALESAVLAPAATEKDSVNPNKRTFADAELLDYDFFDGDDFLLEMFTSKEACLGKDVAASDGLVFDAAVFERDQPPQI